MLRRRKGDIMKRLVVFIALLALVAGCATYRSQYVSFRPPQDYPNARVQGGITVGGEAFADASVAEDAFGFDIRGAGMLPVQVVLTNNGGHPLEIVSSQTFLVDPSNRYWQVIANRDAVERVEKATKMGAYFGTGAVQGATLGAVGGAILGAAIGIVSGENVGSALGKGAALGGAAGAVIGGGQEGTSEKREIRIIDDLREKGLEGKSIPAGGLASGFIFFPGEAPGAKVLKLMLRERDTGAIYSFDLAF
jgi:hypothetical protein